MTDNKRIALNMAATYGRSLYALVVGLFATRWVLKGLGDTDYGLMGLIGGLAMFITFLNNLFAVSVGRFYALAVGSIKRAGYEREGLNECRRWFNTALVVHSVASCVLVAIGYPLGLWAVKCFLAIPDERVESCVLVWGYTCFSSFVNMFCVPFQAMYTAKQEIAELTVYGFITSTLNFLFYFYISEHPGFWLTKYAAWTCAVSVVPQLLIAIRAMQKYSECRFVPSYLLCSSRLKELARYTVARFWASISGVVGAQGQSILVNKYMGPVFNASMTIGNAVAGQAVSFSGALSAAFWPAIANKVGEGDPEKVRWLSFFTCRMGAICVLAFAIPLALELDNVLQLWLVNPPPFADVICAVVLVRAVFEKMTEGYELAIFSTGNGVMKYSWLAGWAGFSTAAVAWGCFVAGLGMWSVCVGLVCSKIITVLVRLSLGSSLVGLHISEWVRKSFVPLMKISLACLAVGIVPRFLIETSIWRVCLTTGICEVVFIYLVWSRVFEPRERDAIVLRIRAFKTRFTVGPKFK